MINGTNRPRGIPLDLRHTGQELARASPSGGKDSRCHVSCHLPVSHSSCSDPATAEPIEVRKRVPDACHRCSVPLELPIPTEQLR